MEPWIVIVIVVAVGVLFYIAQHFGWIDLSNKSKSSGSKGGSALGIGDEVFHPTRHEAQIEMDRQTVLPAPAPLPGDGDKGIYDGQVKIDLTGEPSHGKHAAE
ncbi:MAG: hypothetical protein JWP85_1908 [Rhodoglobus sp.]|nr:hypothetical protein [Rhodoglobus sp.]